MQRLQNLQNQLNYTTTRTRSFKKIQIERLEKEQIGIIYLNSPSDLNALSAQMRKEISQAAKDFDQDNGIKVIIILSKVAKAFCAGADIKEFENNSLEKELTYYSFSDLIKLGELRKVLICGINGVALGGGLELALFSDILICSEETRMGLPELKLGLIPGMHGTQRLAKIIGKQQAMRYILTSDMIDAQQALKMGLVSSVVKIDQLREECIKMGQKISQKSLYTLIVAKQAIRQGEELGLHNGNKYERMLYSMLHGTKASKEGVQAFLDKRAPNFKDI